MTKKNKAKSGAAAAKKSAKKKSSKKSEKETNPAGVRKEVSKMVESEAVKMAQAVIAEGKKGQLATMKYLFEIASIFPPETDPDSATADEDCLAKTLLRRLNIPEEPIRRDEEGEIQETTVADAPAAKPAEDGKKSGTERDCGEAGTEAVVV
jgi:hypothetical protein